jgi:hypothetical protein
MLSCRSVEAWLHIRPNTLVKYRYDILLYSYAEKANLIFNSKKHKSWHVTKVEWVPFF